MLRSTLALGLAVLLASPAGALATDRFVRDTGSNAGNDCTDSLVPCQTIQHAVGQSSDGDTIHVGPGAYTGAVSATNRVHIVGAGAGLDPMSNTVLQPASGFAIRMFDGGSVKNMRVTGGGGGGVGQALVVSATGAGGALDYTVQDAVLLGGSTGSAAAPALQVLDSGTGRPVTVTAKDALLLGTAPGSVDVATVLADGPVSKVALVDATVRGGVSTNDVGVELTDGAETTVTDSAVGADASLKNGIELHGDGTAAEVTRSRVAGTGPIWAVADSGLPDAMSVTVRDSVIGPVGSANGLAIAAGGAAGSDVTVDVRRSTLLARANAVGALYIAGDAATATATLVDSIAHNAMPGDHPDVFAIAANGGTATMTASGSVFDSSVSQGGATVPAPGGGTNAGGDPLFRDAANDDFSVLPGSPAIDRGGAPVAPGETDLAGAPRSVDGDGDCQAAPDAGAYELQGQAKPCPPAVVPQAQTQAQTPPAAQPAPLLPPRALPAARISRLRLTKTKTTFVLDRPAAVTLTVERELPGLRRGRRCAKPTKALRAKRAKRCTRLQKVATRRTAARAGTNSIALKRLKKGRYRATLTADGGASPAVTRLTAR